MMKADAPIFIHYVHDMKRAIGFYQTVFDVNVDFESPGWSTINFEGFQLALHILAPGQDDESVIPHAGMNLRVANIEAAQAAVEKAGGRLTELREPAPNVPVRLGSFVDTEGNGFELRQDV